MGGMSAVAVCLLTVHGTGCSSSSSAGGAGAADSGVADTGQITETDTGTARDSGAAPSYAPSGDAAAECPPASTSSFTASTYVAATGHQGVCSTTAIADFLSACVTASSSTVNALCGAWQTTNIPSDAGAGTACGNCIVAPDNNGGLWIDPLGNFWPNYGACIQLTDSVHGPACAAAYNNASGCEDVGCEVSCNGSGACGQNAGCNACEESAAENGCKTYAATEQTACATEAADGGAFDTCSPGSAINSQVPDFSYIITLICGGSAATDGGSDQ